MVATLQGALEWDVLPSGASWGFKSPIAWELVCQAANNDLKSLLQTGCFGLTMHSMATRDLGVFVPFLLHCFPGTE
jgi:hypothetical protein